MVDTTNTGREHTPPVPPQLEALAHIEFDIRGRSGVDFHAWPGLSKEEVTAETLQPGSADPAAIFWKFGQDRLGGTAAFWQVRPDRDLVDQPVVFLGCDGELGVVASDFGDFLWVLADGYGPREAADPRDFEPVPNPGAAALAERFAPEKRQSAESAIGRARSEFPEFEQTMARLRFEKPVNYPLLFPADMARATHAEVAAKVDRLRALLPNGDYDDYIAQFAPGVELDERQLLDAYLECIDFEAEYRGGPAHAGSPRDDLRVPPELIALFGITEHPRAGYLDLGLNPRRLQGEIMDPDGECCRLDEHWIRVGLLGNDLFLVSLTSGEVMFADQYFWRYAEKDASRVVAPDLLTFFNEYLVGPRYREFASPEELENPRGWFAFLRDNGFA